MNELITKKAEVAFEAILDSWTNTQLRNILKEYARQHLQDVLDGATLEAAPKLTRVALKGSAPRLAMLMGYVTARPLGFRRLTPREYSVIDRIIVHCSATRPSQDIGAKTIHGWHRKRKTRLGSKWSGIGYHFVIRRGGEVEQGRPLHAVGAHCPGQNKNSIGVCLVGGINKKGRPDANFTYSQYTALIKLITDIGKLMKAEGVDDLVITGHRSHSAKACPSFDVEALLSDITILD